MLQFRDRQDRTYNSRTEYAMDSCRDIINVSRKDLIESITIRIMSPVIFACEYLISFWRQELIEEKQTYCGYVPDQETFAKTIANSIWEGVTPWD